MWVLLSGVVAYEIAMYVLAVHAHHVAPENEQYVSEAIALKSDLSHTTLNHTKNVSNNIAVVQ